MAIDSRRPQARWLAVNSHAPAVPSDTNHFPAAGKSRANRLPPAQGRL